MSFDDEDTAPGDFADEEDTLDLRPQGEHARWGGLRVVEEDPAGPAESEVVICICDWIDELCFKQVA